MPQTTNCPDFLLAIIPWYPGGLTQDERGAVESHAADCQACRAELAFLRGDEEPAGELPDTEQVYARVLERVRAHEDREDAAPRHRAGSRVMASARRLRRRLVQPVGIAAGLLVAVVSGMMTVGVIWVAREAPEPVYATATAGPTSAAGVEVEIVFRPDVTAYRIGTDLRAAGASLSGGPDRMGVYRARLAPDADADASLELLRGAGHGVAKFAERSIR